MIKRCLIAVGLIGVCLLSIHSIYGLDQLVVLTTEQGFKKDDRKDHGTVVPVKDKSGKDSAVSIVSRGRVHFPHDKEVPHPDGGTLRLPIYVLDAENNDPVLGSPGEIRLYPVVVKFYKILDQNLATARSVHSGTLHAREAFLHVDKDAQGRANILADRDIRLYGVHLETAPNAPVQDLEMTVAELFVRHSKRGLELRTPNDFLEFEILLGGKNPMTLTGEGLTVILPSEEDDTHDKAIELHVTRNPVLTGNTIQLSADGPLDYIEDFRSGTAALSMSKGVVANFEPSINRNIIARCTTLEGQLLRRKKTEGSKQTKKNMGAWRHLVLTGTEATPVTVDADQGQLRCDKLEAMPATDGQPYLFVASGSPARKPILTLEEKDTVITAEKRIHLVGVQNLFRPLHPAFPMPMVPRLTRNLVIFEGLATLKRGDLSLRAGDGLRILQAGKDKLSRVIKGLGNVVVDQKDLHITSTRGFLLTQVGEDQVLRLGPAEADASHQFDIKMVGDQALTLTGTGLCRIIKKPTGTVIFVRSPDQNLIVETVLDHKQASIENVHTLTANIREKDGKQVLDGLVAEGDRCHLEGSVKNRHFHGYASRIESPNGLDTVLFGDAEHPARLEQDTLVSAEKKTLQREGRVLEGPRIELHPLLGDDLVIQVYSDSRRQAHVSIKGKKTDDKNPASNVSLRGDEIHWLPYLLPPVVLHAHGRNLYRDRLFARNLAAPHVWARGRVSFDVTAGPAGTNLEETLAHAEGDLFVMQLTERQGARQYGFLRGTPALFRNKSETGREAEGRAKLVRFNFADNEDYSVDLLSVHGSDTILFLAGDPKGQVRTIDRIRVSCRGDIHGDAKTIHFLGPVRIRGLLPKGVLDADGSDIDPDGIDMRANSMDIMRRDEIITKITAVGDVIMKWSKIQARGTLLTLWPQTNICQIEDTEQGAAVVVFPNGTPFIGKRMKANLATMSIEGWQIRTPSITQKD